MSKPPAPQTVMPRKKPRQQRSANTVAAILEAAAHILESVGFDGYTTNAVAARAGVSIGSLYQYFPNRDAVTRALIARKSEELLADILRINEMARGSDGILAVLEIAVRQQLRHGRLARILDMEEARLPLGEVMGNHGARAAGVIRMYLEQAGDYTIDTGTAVRDVMAITLGMVDAAGQHGEHDEAALLVRVSLAVFAYLDAIANLSQSEAKRDRTGGIRTLY